MADDRVRTGAAAEASALQEYLRRGYRPVARNWRCALGEIDLVLARDGALVVCEVKARRGSALGGPFEAVTPSKQRRLRRLATAFLAASGPELATVSLVRFDVASVTVDGRGRMTVHLFEDAF
jgi:putative endonuclease